MRTDRLVKEDRVRDLVKALVNDRWELFDHSPEFHCAIEAMAQSTALIVDCLAYGCEALSREADTRKVASLSRLADAGVVTVISTSTSASPSPSFGNLAQQMDIEKARSLYEPERFPQVVLALRQNACPWHGLTLIHREARATPITGEGPVGFCALCQIGYRIFPAPGFPITGQEDQHFQVEQIWPDQLV